VIKFSIRDICWITTLVAVALLLLLERWRHDGEIERMQANTQEAEQQHNSLQWQLVSAADILEDAGYKIESDDECVEVTGPFPQGHVGVEIAKVISDGRWTGHCIKEAIGTKKLTPARMGRLIGGREMRKEPLPPLSAEPSVERR
jgi:hypothetical protein